MSLFTCKSLSTACSLEEAANDHRTAHRVGQYRIGRQAAYVPAFPGTRYVPFQAVTHAWSRHTSVTVKGCCGKELPMVRVRLFYDGEFYQDFMLETLAEANALLDRLQACRPDVPVERETVAKRCV